VKKGPGKVEDRRRRWADVWRVPGTHCFYMHPTAEDRAEVTKKAA